MSTHDCRIGAPARALARMLPVLLGVATAVGCRHGVVEETAAATSTSSVVIAETSVPTRLGAASARVPGADPSASPHIPGACRASEGLVADLSRLRATGEGAQLDVIGVSASFDAVAEALGDPHLREVGQLLAEAIDRLQAGASFETVFEGTVEGFALDAVIEMLAPACIAADAG